MRHQLLLCLTTCILFAPVSGNSETLLHSLNAPDFSLAGGGFGSSVSIAGDVNRDGYSDIVIGSPYDGNDNSIDFLHPISALSTVTVFSGRNYSKLYTFNSNGPNDNFGFSVTSACDVNADGYADIIAGTGSRVFAIDYVKVFSGASGQLLYEITESQGDSFGYAVACLGDLNGDGRHDFAVSAPDFEALPNTSGYVKIYSGLNGSTLGVLTAPLAQNQVAEHFGTSIAGGADLNGDGRSEILVGLPKLAVYTAADPLDPCNGAISAGFVLVYSGAAPFQLIGYIGGVSDCEDPLGNSSGELLGTDVAFVGDTNGDGYSDILASSRDKYPTNSPDRYGAITLFSGLDGSKLFSYFASVSDEGTPISALGDINGDGNPDFAISSASYIGDFSTSSAVKIISGASGAVLQSLDAQIGDFGFAIAGRGDVNHGGVGDIAIATPFYHSAYAEQRVAKVDIVSLSGDIDPNPSGTDGNDDTNNSAYLQAQNLISALNKNFNAVKKASTITKKGKAIRKTFKNNAAALSNLLKSNVSISANHPSLNSITSAKLLSAVKSALTATDKNKIKKAWKKVGVLLKALT